MKDGVIYHTDKEWFNYLIENKLTHDINFWTSRTKSKLKIPNKVPFFFKTEDGEIVGVSDYIKQEYLTLREMWEQYGPKSGVNSFEELLRKAREVLSLDESKIERQKFLCIILDNMVKFRYPIKLSLLNLSKIQVMKYINNSAEINQIFKFVGISKDEELNIEAIDPIFKETFVKSRTFQSQLREYALKYYNNKCAICGIDIKELLNVSHIIPVKDDIKDAGKVENTLLLCKLHDAMFDKGLITINKNAVLVSKKCTKTNSSVMKDEIAFLNQVQIQIDLTKSENFLDYHRNKIFKQN